MEIVKQDLIIGAIDNYSWSTIKYWVNSIDKCGFTGNKIMVVMNSDGDTVKRLVDKGFVIVAFDVKDGKYSYTHNGIPPHVSRFFHIWHTLNKIAEENSPRFVITTDVRDVIFQTNPSTWLENNLPQDCDLVVTSESLSYKDEPWGRQNLKEAFGEFFYEIYKNETIFNVGTFAGRCGTVRDLALMIFQMSINRPIPIVDQAVFNFLLWQKQFRDKTIFASAGGSWCCTLGTQMDPSKIEDFRPKLLDKEPTFDADGVVSSAVLGKPYALVHQYDRVPNLRPLIERKYAE